MSPQAGSTHNFTVSDVGGGNKYGFMLPRDQNGNRPLSTTVSEILRPRTLTMGELTQAEFPPDIALTWFQEDWQAGIGGISHRNDSKTLADATKVDASGVGAKLQLARKTTSTTVDTAPSEYVPSGFAAMGDQVWAGIGRYPYRWDFTNKQWDRRTIPTGYDSESLLRNGVKFEGNIYKPRWADDAGSGGSYTSDDEPSVYWYKAPGDAQWIASTLGAAGADNDAFKYLAVANGSLYGGYAAVYTDSTEDVQVNVDAVTSNVSTNSNSITISHTVGTGDDRLLIVGVSAYSTESTRRLPSGVTYNAVAMTEIANESNGDYSVSLWRLAAPATGANNVVISFSGTSPNNVITGIISYRGVDQSSPVGTSNSATGTGTGPTVDITTVIGDLVIDTLIDSNGTDTTDVVDASQTERWSQDSGTVMGGDGSTEIATGTTTTMSWTLGTSSDWATMGVGVKVGIGASSTTIYTTATPTANFSVGDVIRIEDELMLVTAISDSPASLTVVRAYRGTAAVAHTGANNIYKVTLNKHHIHASTDPTNTGSWGVATVIGDSSSEITGLLGSDTDLIIFKTDGVYRLESGGTPTELRPEMKTMIQPDFGRGAYMWNDKALIPLHGGGMWELDTSAWTFRDISFSKVMPEQTQYHGQVCALDGSPDRLYCLVHESANTQYHLLMAEYLTVGDTTDYRWHHLATIGYTTGTDTKHVNIYYEGVEGDNGDIHDRIWVGIESTGSNLLPYFVPASGDDVDPDFTDDSDCEAITTIWDGNLPNVKKRLQKIECTWANLGSVEGTDHNIRVQYRVDGGSWTYISGSEATSTLGKPSGATSPQTLTFASEITGKLVELKFLPERGSTTNTSPELHDFTLTAQLRPDTVEVIPFSALLMDGELLLNGTRDGRVQSRLAQIKTWRDQAAEVTVEVGDTPYGTTSYTCVFLPQTFKITQLGLQRNRRPAYLVQGLMANVA